MTLTLASSRIPLALKVLLHVGLVRSERCGVLAECPISIFSSFLLNVCQKTTVITHEQGKFPSSRSPEECGSALRCPLSVPCPGFGVASGISMKPNTQHEAQRRGMF